MSGIMSVLQKILAIINAILALFGGGAKSGEYTVDEFIEGIEGEM